MAGTPISPGATVSPTATASPGGPAASIDLHCRLPVFEYAASPGGWVTFPGGQLTVDPAAEVSIPGVGLPGRTYDWRFHRWIPVFWSAESPDYSRYAYVGGDNAVHMVDVATATDRAIPGTRDMIIIGFEADGIYSRRLPGVELWRIDPSTGSVQQVLDQGLWLRIGGGAAWGTTMPGPLIRVNLHDASTALWYTRPGGMGVFGIDRTGHPVVGLSDTGGRTRIIVLSGPDQGDVVYPSGTLSGSVIFENNWQAPSDQHGVWLAGTDGIYLVTPAPAPTIVKVSDVRAVPVGACN
jgi:hypothetical protein